MPGQTEPNQQPCEGHSAEAEALRAKAMAEPHSCDRQPSTIHVLSWNRTFSSRKRGKRQVVQSCPFFQLHAHSLCPGRFTWNLNTVCGRKTFLAGPSSFIFPVQLQCETRSEWKLRGVGWAHVHLPQPREALWLELLEKSSNERQDAGANESCPVRPCGPSLPPK